MNDPASQSRLQAAVAHHQAGRLAEAAAEYAAVLRREPQNPDALHLLGLAKHQSGDSPRAIELITQAVTINPQAPDFPANLARIYASTGRVADAAAWMTRAVNMRPDDPELRARLVNYLVVLGTRLVDEDSPADALGPLEQAVRLKPDQADALANLGVALSRLKRYGEAVKRFEQALAIRPDLAAIHTNLGAALLALGRPSEAAAAHRRACELEPNWLAAKSNLAIALAHLGEYDEALRLHEQVLSKDPAHPNSLFNRGIVRMTRGDFTGGWADYEARFRVPELKGQQTFPEPRWNGEDARDKTILVYAEQGLGDAIQFARYLPQVVARSGKVVMQCQPALLRLMRQNFPEVEVVPRGEALPGFDLHVPIMSLPHAFGTTLDTIPNAVPYLRAPIGRPVPKEPSKLSVGLVWAGHPGHYNDRNRSLRLDQLLPPLLAVPDVQFFSLQKAHGPDELTPFKDRVHDLASSFEDLADTAGAIQQLDLIITVDTSIAHLAGALGAKTWTLLPTPADFRWMEGRDDSPWYTTMRLFRQPRAGDWKSVVESVAAQLAREAERLARLEKP